MNRIVALSILAIMGCTGPTQSGPRVVRQLGILVHYSSSVGHSVPERGTVGIPVSITVRTVGGGCVRQGDTETRRTGLTADITPYDLETVDPGSNTACPDILRVFNHETALTFDRTGIATVRIHGREQAGGRAVTVQRTITIE